MMLYCPLLANCGLPQILSMLNGCKSEHVTPTKPIRSFSEKFSIYLEGELWSGRTKEGGLFGVTIPNCKGEPAIVREEEPSV